MKIKVVRSLGAVPLALLETPVFKSVIKPEVVVSQYKSKSDSTAFVSATIKELENLYPII